jgi:hypothetical protein
LAGNGVLVTTREVGVTVATTTLAGKGVGVTPDDTCASLSALRVAASRTLAGCGVGVITKIVGDGVGEGVEVATSIRGEPVVNAIAVANSAFEVAVALLAAVGVAVTTRGVGVRVAIRTLAGSDVGVPMRVACSVNWAEIVAAAKTLAASGVGVITMIARGDPAGVVASVDVARAIVVDTVTVALTT